MYVKKVKRKCSVRGCKNTESYSVSLTREIGNSVIICKKCLKSALSAVENYSDDKTKNESSERSVPPLFFNAAIAKAEVDAMDENNEKLIISSKGGVDNVKQQKKRNVKSNEQHG